MNHRDDLILASVAVAGVAMATEPLWRPKVEAVLKPGFAKLAPNRPTPPPETQPSTIHETLSKFSRSENRFPSHSLVMVSQFGGPYVDLSKKGLHS